MPSALRSPRSRRLNLRASPDQRRFLLSAGQWKAFVAALDRPPQPNPRLRRLLSEPSILDRRF